ncbi:hypothetical protein WA026_011162 [Henosepilachna vigintioctopunctata]|uniref:Tetratricopeptide repeat protein 12 n=1 Tax=Henosepilachna vigintioctopunctata TaxID=420089 RepID=A0AAW1U5V7_9CUCU
MSISLKNLERQNEEFHNFMHKVTEVERIVKKLVSEDQEEQAMGDAEAKKYLGEMNNPEEEILDNENVQLKIKSNRTLINQKAIIEMSSNANTTSQESFMREVEKDAEQRFQEKKIRLEKMGTLKKRAILAFNRNEFEKTLCCYNKALELVKDNHNLFLSRGLTYIKLKLLDKALSDIDRALYLNENSLKGYLLKAKIFYLTEREKEIEEVVREAKERHSKKVDFIDEYIRAFTKDE